jgi:hypothetical protein
LPYIQGNTGENIALISHYIIPYGVIFAIGLRVPTLTSIQVGYLSAVGLLIFLMLGTGLYFISGSIVSTQTFKYPPSLYYFSYAIFVSGLLWIYSSELEVMTENINVKPIVIFCAQNSIWIYLWHIPIVKIFQAHYLIKYLVVLGVAVTIVVAQGWLVKKAMAYITNDNLKKNIKIIFTG